MDRRTAVAATLGAGIVATLAGCANAQEDSQPKDDQAAKSLDTVMAFIDAMGKGDMDTVGELMADDMVWHNEGDERLPWIGNHEGKEAVFAFLEVFSANLQTTKWENSDAFASGDTVAVFGAMNATATKTGQATGDFSFALRAKVRDDQVVLWQWFEDSFAVSQAYNA